MPANTIASARVDPVSCRKAEKTPSRTPRTTLTTSAVPISMIVFGMRAGERLATELLPTSRRAEVALEHLAQPAT